MLSENNENRVKIDIDKSIAVPGYRHKKRPDILISDVKTGQRIYFIELKKTFNHRSLTNNRQYKTQLDICQRIGKNTKFLYIIFHASKTKIQTYKKSPHCRIVCCNFDLNKDKCINPRIIDSIESILEEIYETITLHSPESVI